MTVAAVERAFRLLRAVPETDGTLSGLARETGLPVATVSRLMETMEQAGAVTRGRTADRDGKAYRIGPAVMELAGTGPASYDLLSLASTHLNAIVAETGETAGVAAPVGTEYVILGQVVADNDVSVRDWTGERTAVHAGCIGFVQMAHWDRSEVESYLNTPLEAFSAATVIDPASIEQRLALIRSQGWFSTTDEYAVGVTTIAAPIFDRAGRVAGSIYVHGPSYRFPASGALQPIGEGLRGRADAVSAVLGHREAAE